MRRSSFALLAVVLVIALAPALAAKPAGTVYGKGVAAVETVKLSEIMAHPDDYVGKTVRVEGLVVDVCEKRGCWMELAGDKEFQSIKIKVDDGVIVFPMDAKGKHAVAEGVFTKIVLSAEQATARHEHDKEHGENAEGGEPCANDVKPGVIYMIKGTGAVVS